MIEERRVALARMTSPEASEALARAEVALLAVGATEQHGPNMTLETDTAVAYQLALHIATALYPRAVVAPPLPFGVSYHHMKFAGTMTLSPETFQAVVLEVVDSLRQHGIERFFIVDGHAGNQGALDVLMTKLRFQMGIRAAYLFYFTLVDDIIREGVKTERWGRCGQPRCRTAIPWGRSSWACRSLLMRSRKTARSATLAWQARHLAKS